MAAFEVWRTTYEEQRLFSFVEDVGFAGYVTTVSLRTFSRVHEAARDGGVLLGYWESLFRPEAAAFFSGTASLNAEFSRLGLQPGSDNGANEPLAWREGPPVGDTQLGNPTLAEDGWFYAPACEGNRQACIPVVLGNRAWNFMEWCLVAMEQRLPLAITFLGWPGTQTVVQELSDSHAFLFYHWMPDDTFRGISTAMTIFDEEILYIRQFQYTHKVAWPRLREVDQQAFNLLQRFHLSKSDMDFMLNAEGDAETRACHWLQNNSHVWAPFIQSQCPQGSFFGESEQTCASCPRGTYSSSSTTGARLEQVCTSCPAGRSTRADGSTSINACVCSLGYTDNGTGCEPCAAGKSKDELGFHTCTWCLEGQYAPQAGMSRCEDCPIGEFSSNEFTACQACPLFQNRLAGQRQCSTDPAEVLALTGLVFVVMQLALLMPTVLFLRLPVQDVSLENGSAVVTTCGPHYILRGLSRLQRQPMSVRLRDTGCPLLDAQKFKVRVLDRRRLALLHADGIPVTQRVDSSMGVLAISFPVTLLYTRLWYIPNAVTLPVLLVVATRLANVLRAWLHVLMAVVAGLVIAVVMWVYQRWTRWNTPLTQRISQFHTRLLWAGYEPQEAARGPDRAVTAGQIRELHQFFQSFIRDRDMYYVCSNIILPLTRRHKLSYAELVGPSELTWFVSHYWGSSFRGFVETISKHACFMCGENIDPMSVSYWVCSLSINQWRVKDELGESWHQSSFYLALRSGVCCGTVMVIDEQALPLQRAWCLFELLQTLLLTREDQDFEGLLFCTSMGVLNYGFGTGADVPVAVAKRLADLDLKDADASDERDKAMIHQLVESMPGGFESVNGFVRIAVGTALQACRDNFEKEFDALMVMLNESVPDSVTTLQVDEIRRMQSRRSTSVTHTRSCRTSQRSPRTPGLLFSSSESLLRSGDMLAKRSGNTSRNSIAEESPVAAPLGREVSLEIAMTQDSVRKAAA